MTNLGFRATHSVERFEYREPWAEEAERGNRAIVLFRWKVVRKNTSRQIDRTPVQGVRHASVPLEAARAPKTATANQNSARLLTRRVSGRPGGLQIGDEAQVSLVPLCVVFDPQHRRRVRGYNKPRAIRHGDRLAPYLADGQRAA